MVECVARNPNNGGSANRRGDEAARLTEFGIARAAGHRKAQAKEEFSHKAANVRRCELEDGDL
jgi:hypothetical protein